MAKLKDTIQRALRARRGCSGGKANVSGLDAKVTVVEPLSMMRPGPRRRKRPSDNERDEWVFEGIMY